MRKPAARRIARPARPGAPGAGDSALTVTRPSIYDARSSMTDNTAPADNRTPARSKVLGRVRLLAVYTFIAALVWICRPTPALTAAGAAFALAGEALRMWAAGHLTKSVRLITSGPYAYTQNPIYLGRLLI